MTYLLFPVYLIHCYKRFFGVENIFYGVKIPIALMGIDPRQIVHEALT